MQQYRLIVICKITIIIVLRMDIVIFTTILIITLLVYVVKILRYCGIKYMINRLNEPNKITVVAVFNIQDNEELLSAFKDYFEAIQDISDNHIKKVIYKCYDGERNQYGFTESCRLVRGNRWSGGEFPLRAVSRKSFE